MSGRPDDKYDNLADTRCVNLSAHQVPALHGPVAHSAWHQLGSIVDAPLEDQVLPMQALRVAGRLPT